LPHKLLISLTIHPTYSPTDDNSFV